MDSEQTYQYTYPEEGSPIVKVTTNGVTFTSQSKNDHFGRKEFEELQTGKGFVSRQFSYVAGEVTEEHKQNGKLKSTPTTNLISQIVLSGGRTISYEYDEEERITKVDDSVDGITTYTYDALGQLVTEKHKAVGAEEYTTVNTMTYDNYGNIKTKNGVEYVYDRVWKDLLIKVGDDTITYDAQGNPISYHGHTLMWEKGRQLKLFDDIQYTYNANGIRTSKTIDGVRHEYLLDGAKILREAWNYDVFTGKYADVLIPLYDNEESVCGIIYNGTPYYFQKNLQGDVISITDADGTVVANYTYDAWGKLTCITGAALTIATVNPFRYRGYYYDEEIGMYYLQSRYYDPMVGRFVNADEAEYIKTNVSAVAGDMFTYCENDPVNLTDANGNSAWEIIGKIIKYLSDLAGKLGDFLLNKFGLSRKGYAHKLKYNNATALTKFVNNNKKTIKKLAGSASKIGKILEIVIVCCECFNSIRKNASQGLIKTIARLIFQGLLYAFSQVLGKLIAFFVSKFILVLCWARFLIELAINTLFDYLLSLSWVGKIEELYVSAMSKQMRGKINFGKYLVTFISTTAKAIF